MNIIWNSMKEDIFPNLTRPPKDYLPPALYRPNLNKNNNKDKNGSKL